MADYTNMPVAQDGGCMWMLLLIALLGGFSGNRGVAEGGLYAPLQFQTLDGGIRGLERGQCELGYQMTNGVKDGFYNLASQLQGVNTNFNNSMCTLGYQGLQHASMLADKIDKCCCEMKTVSREGTDRVLAWLNDDRAKQKDMEILELKQKLQTFELMGKNCFC